MVSIYDPSYIVSYEEPNITQLAYISTLSIAAYSESNSPTNLKIGSSSNLILQARQGFDFYFNSNNEISFYTSTAFGSNISKLLTIGSSNDQPYFFASNINFKLDGTTNIGNAAIFDSNNYQLLETSNSSGFLFNNDTSFSSNLIIDKDITTYQNIGCAGNIFSSTINLFKDSPNSSVNSNLNRVGYSFYVNKYNQLEILRTDQYTSNMEVIQKNSRIITFGNSEFPNNLKDNPDSYKIMKEFSGINGNYSNGATVGMTNALRNSIVGYCNLLINSESSTSTDLAPTASNLTVLSSRLYTVSNVAYETALTGINTSNVSYRSLNIATVASNIAITAYSIASMASNAVVNTFFTADFASNMSVNLSNYAYTSLPEALVVASNANNAAILAGGAALTASISAMSASNAAFSLNNNVTQALAKATSASNIAFGLNSNIIQALINASDASIFAISASNNSYLSWTNTGDAQYTYTSNVGIGTSNPLSKLHISHDTFVTSNPILFEVGSDEIGWSSINFNGYGNQQIAKNKNRWRVAVDQTSNNDSFIIDTFNGSSNITLLNAISNGYIGIGISNPSYNLDVEGDINLSGKLLMNGVAQWNNAESNIYVIDNNVSIGKSNATSALDVAGTITACNIFALNIPMKTLSGNIVMSSTAYELLTLGSENAGSFYNLYVGPTKNYPYFLTANIFYDSTSDTLVTYVTGSNIDLNLTVSSSNLLISSVSTAASIYPWSLYRM